MTRVPIKTVNARDKEALRTLDDDIKGAVFGQDDAIGALASAIKLSRAGLRDPVKPIGCYLFAGPTGVGKTEVAKQLAKVMGIELIRFDMSEYMERHAVSRLIGAPPGYVGFDQGGLLDRCDRPAPPRRAAARRDREGAPGCLQHPAAGDGLRQAHRQQRQDGRFPQHHPDHDHQCRCRGHEQAGDGLRPEPAARGRGYRGDQAPVHAGVPQPPRRGDHLPRADAEDHPQRGRQVRQGAGRAAGRQARLDRARRRGRRLAGREGLRSRSTARGRWRA